MYIDFKQKIETIKLDIELTFMKLSFYSELEDTVASLKDYLSILNSKYENNNSDENVKTYYVELDTFYNYSIMPFLNLVKNSTTENIFDTTKEDLKAKLLQKQIEIEALITYLKTNFEILGISLESKYKKIVDNYNVMLLESIESTKNKYQIKTGNFQTRLFLSTNSNIISHLFLNELELFEQFDLEDAKRIIEKDLVISKLKEEIKNKLNMFLKDTYFMEIINDFITKSIELLDVYKNNISILLNNHGDVYMKIEELQNKTILELNDIITKIEQQKELLTAFEYLDGLTMEDVLVEIDIDKIKAIEKLVQSTNEDFISQLKQKFYNTIYTMLEIEVIFERKNNLYDSINQKTKRQIESKFLIEIKKLADNEHNIDDVLKIYMSQGFNTILFSQLYSKSYFNKAKLEEHLKNLNVIRNKFETDRNVFSEGLVPFIMNNKFGYRDKQGNIVIKNKFEYADLFSEGLAQVKVNNKWGYIDKQGNIVIKNKFEGAGDFSEGLASVKINGKWGYIDKQGN
ncbi:MAG: WG repeat-containing protein, partial [Bacilli bacterium]